MAPVILIHGNGGSADLGRWAMFELRKNLILEAGYPRELIWAPSYLGSSILSGGIFDLDFPHAHNVGEVRRFIDNVCEYLDVEVVDIIAHSLGCTLAYSVFRGLSKQIEQPGTEITTWSWNEPKKWHRVGTFVALAGAFHGLQSRFPEETIKGEWKPDGDFMKQLLKEELVEGERETPYSEGGPQTPGSSPHYITYVCGIAEGDYADIRSPDPARPRDPNKSTSMLKGAECRVYKYERIAPKTHKDLYSDVDKHEQIIKDPMVIQDIKDFLNSVPLPAHP